MGENLHRATDTPAASLPTSIRAIERRQVFRGTLNAEPSRPHLVKRILGTYAEMPGLSLHFRQAMRLFGLREVTCRVVLADLVQGGQLRQSPDGQYRAA
jgi:hypothetical protein